MPPDPSPSLDDAESVLRESEPPVTTAGEVGDELECSRRHALDLLRLLERAGAAESKTVGARAVAWWHRDRVSPADTPGERGDDPDHAAGAGETPGGPAGADHRDAEPNAAGARGDDHGGEGEGDQDDTGRKWDTIDVIAEGRAADHPVSPEQIERAVEEAATNWGDDEERVEARKEAARAVLYALRLEPQSRSELVERLFERFPVPGQNADTWWRKNIAEVRGAPLRTLGDYNRGTHKWELSAEGDGGQ